MRTDGAGASAARGSSRTETEDTQNTPSDNPQIRMTGNQEPHPSRCWLHRPSPPRLVDAPLSPCLPLSARRFLRHMIIHARAQPTRTHPWTRPPHPRCIPLPAICAWPPSLPSPIPSERSLHPLSWDLGCAWVLTDRSRTRTSPPRRFFLRNRLPPALSHPAASTPSATPCARYATS